MFFATLGILLLPSCGSYDKFSNKATQEYSRTEMQKFAKYMIQGKLLYTTHCSNCHQENGEGLGKVYPPLKNSDYLIASKSNTYCGIKNGISKEIVVNGVVYNQAMPANEQLTDLEIAEICTYIYNSWGLETGFIDVKEVSEGLNYCN
jgi:mono/diheme cytochrome c family protein